MAADVEPDPASAALFEPRRVIVHHATADGAHLELLDRVEAAATAPMAPRRVAEYAAGRVCAHRGLEVLGVVAPRSIGRDSGGAPIWPQGVTGSITHTRGFCLAAVADAAEGTVIGLDAEDVSRVQPAIARRVLTEPERERLAPFEAAEAQRRLAIAFAAKEAFYKAHYQRDPRYLGFDVIEIDVVDDERLTLRPGIDGGVEPAAVAATTARYRIDGAGRVIVAVGIAA